jgi:Tol biopolymer transport system component
VAEGRIDGWKEIASHLGVDQRTAQRWESNDGLPVSREGGKVFAYAAELDRWRSARVVGPAFENAEAVQNSGAVEAASVPGPAATPAGVRRLAFFAVFGVAGFVALGASAWNAWPREAQVLNCTQLTRDGRHKFGPVVTDGRRIFFMEMIGRKRVIASVAVTGGHVTVWDLPMELPKLTGISASRDSLLIDDSSTYRLFDWKPEPHTFREISVPGVLPNAPNFTAWQPSGRWFAASAPDGLTIFEPGSHVAPVKIPLPGLAGLMSWDASGQRLRVAAIDFKAGTSSWWEYSVPDLTPHPLPRLSRQPIERNGSWTSDGRFFVFQAESTGQSRIWVSEGGTARPRAYPLTNDARIWCHPAVMPGAYTVFALGAQSQGELVSLPPSGAGSQRVLPGVSGYEIDYSRDGSAVAYARFPDHTIWRSKPDGSDLHQLSPAGIEAHQPHWSPDGTRIAFMGQRAGDARWRIYIVPSPGGSLDEPLPHGDDQGVPTWSGDGHSLIFGDLKAPAGFEHALIHELDLRTFALSTIPTPVGLWTPRMSPDGRYLAAVSYDNQSLYLRDNRSGTWRKRASLVFLEEPVWSQDSAWIQFAGRRSASQLALFRIDAAQGPAKETVDLTAFESEHVGAAWYGIAPDGSPLGFRGIAEEIYSLNWRLRIGHL